MNKWNVQFKVLFPPFAIIYHEDSTQFSDGCLDKMKKGIS